MLLFVLVMSLGITATYGPGPTFSKFQVRYNGTYSEIHNSSADAGFELYRLYCNDGSELNVTITFDPGLYIEWDVYIFNSTNHTVSDSTNLPYYLGSNNCTIICNYTGYYYTGIRNNDSTVSHAFNLIISIDAPPGTPPIPGFEFVFLMLGMVMAIGLITWLRKDKIKQISII